MIVYQRRISMSRCPVTERIVENQEPEEKFKAILSDCLTVRAKNICSSRPRIATALDTICANSLVTSSKSANKNSAACSSLRYDKERKETTETFNSSPGIRSTHSKRHQFAYTSTKLICTDKSQAIPVQGLECEYSAVNISNRSRPFGVRATTPANKMAASYDRATSIWSSQSRRQRIQQATRDAEKIFHSKIVPARSSVGTRPSTTPTSAAYKQPYRLVGHSAAGRPQTTPVTTSSGLSACMMRNRTRAPQLAWLDTRVTRDGNFDVFNLESANIDVSYISFPALVSKLDSYVMTTNFPAFVTTLNCLDVPSRRKVVNYKADCPVSTSIFFTACQLSRTQFVEFMLKECSPDVEQRGLCTLPQDSTNHRITPLWYAAATGNLEMVRLLAKHNADVNASSSSGTTAVMAACSNSHLQIVSLLVTHGADVHAKNVHGFTCLMSAAQDPKVIQLLMRLGARVSETDMSGNTALHYATEAGNIDAVARLVDMGANPMIVNNDNFNVIQTAAKFRHRPVLEYLLRVTRPKIPEIIDAYLILGAMTIILDNDYTNGLHHWQKAAALSRINTNAGIYYSMRDSVLAQCLHVKELTCLESISRCSSDHDALCIQALLVYERNRGQYHENYINLLVYRGAVSADEEKFPLAINLWKTAYKLQLQKLNTCDENAACEVFTRNAMRTVQFLVKVFYHVHRLGQSRPTSNPGQDECVVPEFVARELLGLIVHHINVVINRYTCSPKCEQFYFLLKCSQCVLLLYLQNYPARDRRPELGMALRNLISLNPRGENNETLLHMCLDITTLDPLECDVSATLGSLWPSQAMLEILILLGADPVAKDFFGNTVLHAAVALHNMGGTVEPGMVTMLLRRGAHVDQVNDLGQTAADLLVCNDSLRQVLHTTSLKCLAARVVASNRIQYVGEVPRTLYRFIELHGC